MTGPGDVPVTGVALTLMRSFAIGSTPGGGAGRASAHGSPRKGNGQHASREWCPGHGGRACGWLRFTSRKPSPHRLRAWWNFGSGLSAPRALPVALDAATAAGAGAPRT